MPKDKIGNHIKIIDAAKHEFSAYGYADASMRRIAAECGMSASGLYKHFASKEEMFATLVDPVLEGLKDLYRKAEQEGNNDTKAVMQYIYDNIDAFKLIVSHSRGTRYENYQHEIALLEEKSSLAYLQSLKSKGKRVREVDPKEFHLLVTVNVNAIFQAVEHDLTREEAMEYANTLETFFLYSWRKVFGLP